MSEALPEIGPDKSLLVLDDDGPFRSRLARAMEKRGFERARSWLDEFWDDALERFRRLAEEDPR